MLKPLATLREKFGAFLGTTPAGTDSTPSHAPAWPAPAPKPQAVIPKLSLARRADRGGSTATSPMLTAPARAATSLLLHGSDASR